MIRLYDILSEEEEKLIDEKVMSILSNVGVEFDYEPAATCLKENGVRMEGNRAFFEPDFVKAKLALAPAEFTLNARDPEKKLVCKRGSFILTPSYGTPFIYDIDGNVRESTYEDYCNIVKLAHVSQNINHSGGNVCEPNEIPDEYRHIKMIEAHVRYSDKPFMGIARGYDGAKDSIDIAAMIHGGYDVIAKTPALVTLINSITPLKYDERMLGALMAHAEYGQVNMVSSLVMSGSTGPVTMAGTLALQLAENLAGVVLAQCVRPGAPCIIGQTSAPADMTSLNLVHGNAEAALYAAATAQMAKFYGVPSRTGGAYNDAILVDAQAGYESMLAMMSTGISGTAFVLHAAGIMQAFNATSYEKFIIDDEICGLVKKFMKGYDFSDEKFVLDDIAAVGPGGHFLFQDSTLRFAREELRRPFISNSDIVEIWDKKGRPSVAQKAKDYWQKQLKDYEPPAMDAALEHDFNEFINARVKELSA